MDLSGWEMSPSSDSNSAASSLGLPPATCHRVTWESHRGPLGPSFLVCAMEVTGPAGQAFEGSTMHELIRDSWTGDKAAWEKP